MISGYPVAYMSFIIMFFMLYTYFDAKAYVHDDIMSHCVWTSKCLVSFSIKNNILHNLNEIAYYAPISVVFLWRQLRKYESKMV